MGRALAFYATQRLRLSKYKIDAKDPISDTEGIKVHVKVTKNRAAKGNPYLECDYYAEYGIGINRIISLPDLLLAQGIVRNAGAWWYYEDENGKPLTIEGVVCKFNSRKAFLDVLRNNEKFCEYFQNQLSSVIATGKVRGITAMSVEEIQNIKAEEKELAKEFKEDSEVATE